MSQSVAPSNSTEQQNKADLRRFVEEVFHQRDLGALGRWIAPEYVEHVPLPPGFPPGREGLKRYIGALLAAFPDFRYTVEDILADGDKLAVRLTARGTHSGEFLGIPPTGKAVAWTEIHIPRIVNGQHVEHWANVDQLGLLQQLGVVPTPEREAATT